jgi:uncharacterized protein YbjT (DUF2867 family)
MQEASMILVSGATGTIGRPLVEGLLAHGARVRMLVRDPSKAARWNPRVERVVGDLDRPETLSPALSGVERLFLVTPVTEQVAALVAAAAEARVRHIVKISTIEAGRRFGPGRWHREQEEVIQASGAAWTFLRPTMLMSNSADWWGETIKAQGRVYFPGGQGRVTPVDADDVAAVACAALIRSEHEGQIYELTGPQALTIAEMVATLSQALDKPLRYVNVPASLAGFAMRRQGLPAYVVKGLLETLGALRRNEYAYTTDAVERVTGQPPRRFEAWCRAHAQEFR